MPTDSLKKTMLTLESLCKTYEKPTDIVLEDLEQTILDLNVEMQHLDLASHENLKTELGMIEVALTKLSMILQKQQEYMEHHVKELCLQQRALSAYARVANNNLGISATLQ